MERIPVKYVLKLCFGGGLPLESMKDIHSKKQSLWSLTCHGQVSEEYFVPDKLSNKAWK